MAGRKRTDRTLKAMKTQAERKAKVAPRAAGYIRVSTEDQAEDGSGLEYQRTAIEAFAKSQGYALVDVVEDAGVSGASDPTTRPGFAHIVAMAQARAIDLVLVWKFDRLARHLAYAVTTTDTLLREHGVGVRSVTEPIDTSTGLGQVVFSVLAGMAAMEREAITRRTWEGRKAKAASGGHAGGQVPYGYRRENGKLTINEDEATIVRRIYAMAKQGRGVRAIASTLTTDGVPTRSGKPWNPNTIAGILDNPRYRGTVDYLFGAQGLAKGWGVDRVLTKADAPAILGKAASL